MFLAIILLAFPVLAQDVSTSQFEVPEGGGIVYGAELGVGVGAPKGWVFDSASGVDQGLHAVMYPDGSSWAKADDVMYVNIALLGSGETLAAFISGDAARFREKSSTLVIKVAKPVRLAGGAEAPLRYYSGDPWGNHEAIAYAAQGRSVAIFVLSCRTEEGFKNGLPAFHEMVAKSFLATMRKK